MTDKQKQAILAINDAKQNGALDDEQYYLLLEFIMGNKPTTQCTPWLTEILNPISTPRITYSGDSSEVIPI